MAIETVSPASGELVRRYDEHDDAAAGFGRERGLLGGRPFVNVNTVCVV